MLYLFTYPLLQKLVLSENGTREKKVGSLLIMHNIILQKFMRLMKSGSSKF